MTGFPRAFAKTHLFLIACLSVVVLSSGACGVDASPATTVVRDSLGVQIVESAERAWAADESWTVEATPILDLSATGAGSPHEFYRVADATRLPDGGIAVALDNEIRLFSSGGEYIRTLGREGDGPGEFRYISRVEAVAPDSLLVLDTSLRRVTLFGPDKEVVRTVRIEVDPNPPYKFEVLDDRFVGIVHRSMHREEEPQLGLHRLAVPVVTISHSGQLRDTLVVVPGMEENLRQESDDVLVYVGALFGRDAHLAVHGGKVIVGDATEMQFQVIRGDGIVERIVRADYSVELTSEVFEAERSAWLEEARTPEDVSFFNSLPVPETRAAYHNLMADPTGAVWLREDRGRAVTHTSFSPHAWEVFGPDGVWLGQVFLPGRFTVFEIGLEHVLGVFRDELDVEHVQVLTLRR